MAKQKKKPVWRKSYIQIVTEKKEADDTESIFCEYCGSSMPVEAMYCPQCGRVRKAEG